LELQPAYWATWPGHFPFHTNLHGRGKVKGKGKGRFPLFPPWRHIGGIQAYLHSLANSALDGGK
jgi:hypothetical protein